MICENSISRLIVGYAITYRTIYNRFTFDFRACRGFKYQCKMWITIKRISLFYNPFYFGGDCVCFHCFSNFIVKLVFLFPFRCVCCLISVTKIRRLFYISKFFLTFFILFFHCIRKYIYMPVVLCSSLFRRCVRRCAGPGPGPGPGPGRGPGRVS